MHVTFPPEHVFVQFTKELKDATSTCKLLADWLGQLCFEVWLVRSDVIEILDNQSWPSSPQDFHNRRMQSVLTSTSKRHRYSWASADAGAYGSLCLWQMIEDVLGDCSSQFNIVIGRLLECVTTNSYRANERCYPKQNVCWSVNMDCKACDCKVLNHRPAQKYFQSHFWGCQ